MANDNKTVRIRVKPLVENDGRCIIYWGDGNRDICIAEKTFAHVYDYADAPKSYALNIIGAAEFEIVGRDGLQVAVESLQNSLLSMPDFMLSGCETSFDRLPESLTSVGAEAFRESSAKPLVYTPQTLSHVGDRAIPSYVSDPLETMTFSSDVEYIGASSFSDDDYTECELATVTFCGDVGEIGEHAFVDKLMVDEEYWSSPRKMYVGGNVGALGRNFFGGANCEFRGDIGEIREGAFRGYAFNSEFMGRTVTISGNVGRIGPRCGTFHNGGTFTVLGNVGTVSPSAFERFSSVPVLCGDIGEIGDHGFMRLEPMWLLSDKFEFYGNVGHIGAYAFDQNDMFGLKNFHFHGDISSIGDYAFAALPNSPTVVDNFVCDGDIREIGDYAFENNASLAFIHGNSGSNPLSGTVRVGRYAFYNCSRFPFGSDGFEFKSLSYAGEAAFHGCDGITRFVIPDSLRRISTGFLRFCQGLADVEISDGVESVGDTAFQSCPSLSGVTIPDSVTSIGHNAFYGCKSLRDMEIPDSVVSLGGAAFAGCENLTSLHFGDGVSEIADDTCRWCRSLPSVTLSDNVTSIGSNAFAYCSSLTGMDMGNSVRSIGSGAFNACNSLEDVRIPDSVGVIGYSAFGACGSLSGVSMGNGVESIGDFAFGICTRLGSLSLPDSVKSIGETAFNRCSSLSSVEIGVGIERIGSNAFGECEGLESVSFAGKTCSDVKSMSGYPWKMRNGVVIYCTDGTIVVGTTE